MALAERAELVARLSLKDDFSGKLKGVEGRMRSLGSTAKTVGKGIGVGLGAGLAVGAGLTIRAVRSGIDSLAELEDATTSVDGAIKALGYTGKVTSGQIAGWANEIEAATEAAFDDKAITQAATTLLRYGKVAPKDLKTTLTVMTDLAAKTGDIESAASKLAKSLADPAHATRVLREVGVTLTKAQQDQIKTWVEAGELGKAQALILGEVAKQTKGAAKAMNGPYRDSQLVFQDVMEDSQRALATGFLPVLMEVRDILSKELAKPETLGRIKEFGEGLAGGLRGLVTAAKGVDWDAVGSSLKLAGQGAKAVYDAFIGMPDWVKTAVLTGWGLNKLSGGALSGALGSGIEVGLKGVFGQFFARGASPANPMWVQSATGGVGGPGGLPVGPGGVLSALFAGAAPMLAAAFLPVLIVELTKALLGGPEGILEKDIAGRSATNTARGGSGAVPTGPLRPGGPGAMNPTQWKAPFDSLERNADIANRRLADGVRATASAVRTAQINQTAAQRTGDAMLAATFKANRPIVTVNVKAIITAGSVARARIVSSTYSAGHIGAERGM